MSRNPFSPEDSPKWRDEFASFLKQDQAEPPEAVNEWVLSFVHAELNPSLQRWGTKLLCIHAITGLLFMTFCPQLGVGPFVGEFGLGHIFMKFGHLPCTAFCGAIFLGPPAAAASIILNREELRAANRHGILNISFLAAISLIGFMLGGGEPDRLNYGVWLIGAVASGWSVLRIGSWFRLCYKKSPKLF